MVLAILAVGVVTAQVEAGGDMEFASGVQDVDSLRSLYDSDAADEFLDEPTRRMLAAVTYISYGALDGNRSPCPSAGAGRSYYNAGCSSSGAVSPYRRSCVQITRCARG